MIFDATLNLFQDDEYIELQSVEENPFSVMAVMEDAYICQEPRDAEMEAFLVTEGSVEVMSPSHRNNRGNVNLSRRNED